MRDRPRSSLKEGLGLPALEDQLSSLNQEALLLEEPQVPPLALRVRTSPPGFLVHEEMLRYVLPLLGEQIGFRL